VQGRRVAARLPTHRHWKPAMRQPQSCRKAGLFPLYLHAPKAILTERFVKIWQAFKKDLPLHSEN